MYKRLLSDINHIYSKKTPSYTLKFPLSGVPRKRPSKKADLIKIRDVHYTKGSPVWHAKNYALVIFYCRGMNFIDLVKLKVKNIEGDRLLYGRSKTGDPFSVRITENLGNNPRTICFPPIMKAAPNIFKSTCRKEGE